MTVSKLITLLECYDEKLEVMIETLSEIDEIKDIRLEDYGDTPALFVRNFLE